MQRERLIPEARLAALWRLSAHTLFNWQRTGFLVPQHTEVARGGRTRYYSTGYIDNIHAVCATGFGGHAIPSAENLLACPHSLITKIEAAAVLRKSYDDVAHRIQRGLLPAIILVPGRVVRLPAALIEVLASSQEGLVTKKTALRILCLGDNKSLTRLDRVRPLEWIRPGKREWYITRESLLNLLPTLLTGNISPEEWWRRCLADTEPALTRHQITLRHHIGARTLDAEIAAGRLLGLRTFGGHVKVPQWALSQFLESRKALPAQAIAALFGVDEATAVTWIAQKRVCRLQHGTWHKDILGVTCPSRQCVTSYIAQHRASPTVSPEEWMQLCLADGVGTMGSQELVETTVGTDEEEINQALANGELRGVWLPQQKHGVPQAAIIRSDATLYRRARERALRRKFEW